MSIFKLKLIKAYFIDNLNKGFIELLIALFTAPVLFAKKQDGSLRFCIDFRALNNLTRKDRYSFFLIDKTFAPPAKLNYVVYDKEMLAIIRSFNNFRAELAGSFY
ncbi:retrotransposon nucleocapsid protein [Drepanopeziza brunnea f. sp. 'multigermtubi' MB_m1]|uniref:Retrotransposon nucleocapsid protein n=1 Tax=Marssonina brunnea f. sp. multigermtubi (strain MB_m1) TaxID=1072389 RepID=K1XU10_MARBU|nr:retrotransposon nucleocapsid protein [Drepanopeziza brunnea f. sp. 'multigermtubi' MB_m1]EKD16094.1 retrotransposon nucleocapsid protein [Drepanopeziza brunnea f. sp. 'multigermtubi' MB_m1]